MLLLQIVLLIFPLTIAQKNPNFAPKRTALVHLFEWKWSDVALECERFLRDKGFGGVQVSPPNENLVILNNNERPWWERYQPVSYKIRTRSGNETEFANMVRRCNAVGVRIYADAVFNHMSAGDGFGTAGSVSNYTAGIYPSVPYVGEDFHYPCPINDYGDPVNVRYCQLVGLKDLDQGQERVSVTIRNYLNHLIDLGVAGFRIDAAKHMWPSDLVKIFSQLNDLNVKHGFLPGAKPFIYQEVLGTDPHEGVRRSDYTSVGCVVEFSYSFKISNVFAGNDKLTYLSSWGPQWGFVDGRDAVPLIDNHDSQRSSASVLTYKTAKQYKMAVAFMLAHPYGTPKIMSSFHFTDNDQGPPRDANFGILSPGLNPDDTCTNGWVCEHRWRQIYNMVGFRNAVEGTQIEYWWTDGANQIAFSRGSRGFVAFTNGGDINRWIKTNLPAGIYCDIISGNLVDGACSGKVVQISDNGNAFISLNQTEDDGALAIHIKVKL